MGRGVFPHCVVDIESVSRLDPSPGSLAHFRLVEERLRNQSNLVDERISATRFDTKSHDFTCTVEYAKEEGESVATLNMQLYGMERKEIESIPAGAIVRVEGGVGGALDVGNRTIFYGSLSHVLGSVRNGGYQWDIVATTNPTHLAFGSPRHAFEGGAKISEVLDYLSRATGVAIIYPTSANRVALEEAYTTTSGSLHEEVRVATETLTAVTGVKHSVSVRPSSPMAIEIVSHRPDSRPERTAFDELAAFRAADQGTSRPSSVFLDAIEVEVFSDYVMYGGTTLSTEEGSVELEQLDSLSPLHQKVLEDPDGEMQFAEYNLETIFDPRVQLDDIINIMERDVNVGTIAGVTQVKHTMGNIDNRGTSWTTSYKGPMVDPIHEESVVRTR